MDFYILLIPNLTFIPKLAGIKGYSLPLSLQYMKVKKKKGRREKEEAIKTKENRGHRLKKYWRVQSHRNRKRKRVKKKQETNNYLDVSDPGT
jgi:hypothetical protein